MSLNQQSTNFYCCKENPFSQYIKQKYSQQKTNDQQIDQHTLLSPRSSNNKSFLLNNKSSRKEKSITQLVHFNNFKNQQIVTNSNGIEQNNQLPEIGNQKLQIKVQHGQMQAQSSVNSENKQFLIETSGNNQINYLAQDQSSPGSDKQNLANFFRVQLSQSGDKEVLKSEQDTTKLVLPLQYFNSPTSKGQQSYINKQFKKNKSQKMIDEIFGQKINQTVQKTKSSKVLKYLQESQTTSKKSSIRNQNDSGNISKLFTVQNTHTYSQNQNALPLIHPAQYQISQILKNTADVMKQFQSPQHSNKKTKLFKNYYVQKVSSYNSVKNLKNPETKLFVERTCVSPFGDAQFDLVTSPQFRYSKLGYQSIIKDKIQNSINEIQNRNSNSKASQTQESVKQIGYNKINQSNLIELQKEQEYHQENQQPYIYKNSSSFLLNPNNIQNNKVSSINHLNQEGVTPSNKSSNRAIDIKSDRNVQSSLNEIAYDRFTLNKQINIKPSDVKKKEQDSKNIYQSLDTKYKQQNYQQVSKKREAKSQICQNYAVSALPSNNQIQLPPIFLNLESKKHNTRSITDINMITNRNKEEDNSNFQLPKIIKSPSLTLIGSNHELNQMQEKNKKFEKQKTKKKTEFVKSINNIEKKQIKRQLTVDILHTKFYSESKIKPQDGGSSDNIGSNQGLLNANVSYEQSRKNKNKSVHLKSNYSQNEIQEEEHKTQKVPRKNKLQRTQTMVEIEQELIQSIRHLKLLITQDEQMKIFISTFCFIEVEEFCFFLGVFLDSIYNIQEEGINSNQLTRNKENSISLQKNIITSQRMITLNDNNQSFAQGSMTNITTEPINEQHILTQSIKLPQYGVERIEDLLKQSFIQANVKNIEYKLQVFRDNTSFLLPDNLLDEIGGRVFVQKMFSIFFEDLIKSKEFLRDCYEEQYNSILEKIQNPIYQEKYVQMICEFLKISSDNQITETLKDKIRSLGIQLSSIDFLILKKRLFYFLLKQKLVITRQQILKIISRLDQLRQIICTDILFIRNPSNLERHIFLSLKSFLVSSSFIKIVTTQQLTDLTQQLINYITSKISAPIFIQYLLQIAIEDNIQRLIESLEFVSIQAFEIYSYLSVEDRSDLKRKFTILRQKLGYEKYISQVLPQPLQIILKNLSEWVQTQITDEPLPKEILLKNLENTELLELIIEFSEPEISAFNYHDSFAAFTYYNITKVQYDFWVRGFVSVLKKLDTPNEDITLAENFLNSIFPDRQSSKESNFKLNKISEQMFDSHIRTASQQKIQVNLNISEE
ncbi:hypothetical protein ABPG72_014146 [Tetrahymena utriculariae]